VELPFSHDAFLDVFGAYNAALWPAVVALWAATAAVALQLVYRKRVNGRVVFGLLGIHWAWSGIAYHWAYFRAINPAAAAFAALFIVQAVWFTLVAVRSQPQCDVALNPRGVVAISLLTYGLVYPVLGLLSGLHYPRMPVFAVPCPTTLVTAGLLLTTSGSSRLLNVIPLLWAAVGSSAAILLGIRADFGLLAAALALALQLLRPRVWKPST
jgi:hypothetical protein